MTETLVDQLPPLIDVQRYLEELSLIQPPESAHISNFGIEQISKLTNDIWDKTDWKLVLKNHSEMLSKAYDHQELALR